MNVKLVLLGALALAAAPLAYAHDPAGTPKNYCEPVHEWIVHDYAPPATGSVIFLQQDGNLAGDCSGTTVVNPGVICVGVNPFALDPNDPLTAIDVLNSIFLGLCDAEIDPPVADFDGHSEFAFGGAWLLVTDGDGTGADGGTVFCFGEPGHHVAFGPFAVDDNVLGAGASFSVFADTEDITMTGNPCGDFESDFGSDCIGFCTVTFPPGLDGSYQVYVTGTAGHIRDGTNDPPSCSDGEDNDNDNSTDWPADRQCEGPLDDDESNGLVPECMDGQNNDPEDTNDTPNGDPRIDWLPVPQLGFGDPDCDDHLDNEESG